MPPHACSMQIGVDPTSLGGFSLSLLPPAEKAKCVADVAAGRPIFYGELFDVHPTSCWRYYHLTQFAKAIGSCSNRGKKRAPLETHLPPTIGVDPLDVLGVARRWR